MFGCAAVEIVPVNALANKAPLTVSAVNVPMLVILGCAAVWSVPDNCEAVKELMPAIFLELSRTRTFKLAAVPAVVPDK